MTQDLDLIYKFTSQHFRIGGSVYNVVLTPELYGEEDGLDFTGNYQGILIHPQTGTFPFQLSPGDEGNWNVDYLRVNSGTAYNEEFPNTEEVSAEENSTYPFSKEIIDEIGKIIQQSSQSSL